jgi:hypothetical protein
VVEAEAEAELFANYGEYRIPDIPGAQIALHGLMDEADDFLRHQYYPFIREHGSALTEPIKQALWDLTWKYFPIFSKAFTYLPRNVPWSDIEDFLQQTTTTTATATAGQGNSHMNKPVSVVREFMRQQSVRSPEWWRAHGCCQDHLQLGVSTIPQAGRGAFAGRHGGRLVRATGAHGPPRLRHFHRR